MTHDGICQHCGKEFVSQKKRDARIFFKRTSSAYLYFDTLDIEKKHNLIYSTEQINYAVTELGKLDQEALELRNQGFTDKSAEIKKLKKDALDLFKHLSKSLGLQINALAEMITTLRSEYRKYSNK